MWRVMRHATAITVLISGLIAADCWGQLTLPSGSSYTQDFDSAGSGLPTGWTVRTGASASSRGTAATFNSTAGDWASSTGSFRNSAASEGSASADLATVQLGRTDRVVGVRQTGSFGNPGAGFELEIANTTGKSGFSLQMKHQMLSVQTQSTTWTVQYSLNGTTWTSLGTYSDPGVFGSTTANYSFGSAIDNKASTVFIRIAALSSSTGSGSRDTYGVDDFVLSWTGGGGVEPPSVSTTGSLVSFATTSLVASSSQTFTVSGSNLTENITVTAPTNFEASSDGNTFGPTASIVRSGSSASASVYVRIKANASAGNISGTVSVSSGTASASLPVSGFVSSPVALPYGPETFETSQGQWYTYSVAGTANWARTSVTTPSADSFMQMNGFGSDVAANDWLILGPMDLTAVTTPVVEFASEKAFSTNVPDELQLKVSSDYAGAGDPTGATWSALTFLKPSSDNISIGSGQVVLDGMGGQAAVYVAFHYQAAGTASGTTARWRIDDVQVYAMTTPKLGLNLSAFTVTEGGSLVGTITVPVAPTEDLVITVTSLDPSEILVDGVGGNGTASTTVTIAAGTTFTTFNIDAPADSTVDGNVSNVQITAEATGYTPGSISVATVVDSDYVLPTVVINKFENGTPDKIELIVVGNGTPGSTVNLQGMIIKDHSSSNTNDTSARYTFASDALWAAVPAGTIIVLTLDAIAVDPNPDNFVIQVGLNNTAYFTKVGTATMDIAGTDMVMIKAAGSSDAGSVGQIHALANGSATATQTGAAGMPKLVGDVGAAGVIFATNPNGVLADYNGTGVALGTKTFGAANNTSNASFLATLRGTSEISMSAASLTLLDKANDPAQSTIVTLTMLPAPTADTVVTLSSDQTSRLTLPATVTVLANTAETTFTATATADGVDSGTVTANVTAQASGYNNGLLQINVVDTDFTTPPVVINEYANAAPSDFVELLVVQDRLDMRGMILKDFAGTVGSGDGGGRSTFTSNALWSSVRAGTLIVVTSDTAAAEDLDPDDFRLVVKRNNTLYFSNSGSFDIATTDMLMIKAAGSPLDGVNGSLHVLAGGDPAGLYFSIAPWPKVITATGSASATAVQLLTPTSSAADLNGSATDLALGGATPTSGTGNGTANTAYITGLKPASSLQAPEITSLPTASIQQVAPFSYTITAINNAGGTYAATGLPAGLSVDATTGVISGSVAATGTYVIGLSATNADWVGVGILTLTVTQAAPVITSATSVNGTVGTAFEYQITASYFPSSYGATGLPAGLTINTTTGLISGTPTVGGVFSVGLIASNSAGSGSSTLTLTVPVPGTTYSGWLNGAGASDAAFLDYVFGAVTPGTLDPSLKPTVAVVPPAGGAGGDTATLVLTYYVRQNTVGLTVTPKTSADLAAGSSGWVTDGVTVDNVGTATTVNGVSVQQKTASVPVSGAKKFLRVEAVQE